jgi:alpha-L-fucosidase 2
MFLRGCLFAAVLALGAQGEDLKDVEYGRAGKYSLRLDLHIPDGAGPFAAVILVHGGGWIVGDKTNDVQPLFAPLSDAGFAWFSISYRLAGDVVRNPLGTALKLGSAENDVRRAVVFVKQHATEYRVNPNKIALIGLSAGGQLGAMAALQPGPDGAVQGMVAFYTPTDLASLARTSSMIPENIREAVEGTVFDDILMAGLKEFSPIQHVTANSPPFLLIHGSDDNLVPFAQSERFRDKLVAVGVPCELIRVEGGGHGVVAWQAARITSYQAPMIRWLKQILTQR